MEKVQVGLRVFYRIVAFFILLVGFLGTAFIIYFRPGSRFEKQKKFSLNSSRYTKLFCPIFGIRKTVINLPPKDQVGLVVGNHMGFVDVLAVNSIIPSLFVTSQEMRRTPFLGTLVELGGCLFVDRRNRSNILVELQEIIYALKTGLRVVIYPEATSHNGEEVLPFKRTLISAAAHAQMPIIPYVINFKSIEGQIFSKRNRDAVCWYGDQTFLSSAIQLFKQKYIEIEIEFLPFFYPQVDQERAFVADTIQQQIAKKFRPVVEKRSSNDLS